MVGEDGSYDYVVDNHNSKVNALSESDSLDVFSFRLQMVTVEPLINQLNFLLMALMTMVLLGSTTSFTEDASSNQVGSLVASFTASIRKVLTDDCFIRYDKLCCPTQVVSS